MSRLFSKDEVQMANNHMESAVFLKYLAVPSGTVAKILFRVLFRLYFCVLEL